MLRKTFQERFPRGRPEPIKTWLLHPESGELMLVRLPPKEADRYWRYVLDRRDALESGSSEPLRKWERSTIRDTRGTPRRVFWSRAVTIYPLRSRYCRGRWRMVLDMKGG